MRLLAALAAVGGAASAHFFLSAALRSEEAQSDAPVCGSVIDGVRGRFVEIIFPFTAEVALQSLGLFSFYFFQNGPESGLIFFLFLSEWARMAQNGPEWPRMAQNGPEWPRMGQNGPEWARMGQNGPEWARMAQNGPEWAESTH
jgi:hypothetical protein